MRDGEIYARGAADDKGQVFMHIKAVEAHLKQAGSLPLQHQVLHRGRRGSRQRAPRRLRPRRTSRSWPPTSSSSPTRRCSTAASRRSATACAGSPTSRSTCAARKSDLHSGVVRRRGRQSGVRAGAGAGADEGPRRPRQDSRLLRRRAAAERRGARGVEEAAVQRDEVPQGARARRGCSARRGYSTLERVWARPTFEVNGLLSGFTGEGAKTVLPAVGDGQGQHAAGARSGSRTRSAICSRPTCRRSRPKTVELKVTRMHGGKPWMTEFDNKYVRAAGRAIEQGFGKAPVFNREGGSIPGGLDVSGGARAAERAVRRRPARRERARARTRSSISATSTTGSSRRRISIRRSAS